MIKDSSEGTPPLGSLILHIVGFAIVQIVGFDPKEARPGDLAIGIALSRFFIRAAVWLMTSIDDWSWAFIDS